ncbi:putative inorganic phosphate cotransporter isoform X2 [Halyomorpha halys]|uniref:putative inorganic phosphate cotransporter isoform X2 n=1 Tax=Halyomorpha halys TaxID=286706 RepID=UPI0006D4CDE0
MRHFMKNGKTTRPLGIRHLQAFILFLCLAVNYLMRLNFISAIKMMTTVVSTPSDQVGPLLAVIMGQLSRWIPPSERSMLGSFVFSGIKFGDMISSGITEWIGDNFGWPSIFYFSGCAGVGLTILWAFLAADDPKSCWFISEEERTYIEEELIFTSEITKHNNIPWRGLLRNKACWTLLLTAMGHQWGNWILLNEVPFYFDSILHLDSTTNVLIAAFSQSILWLFSLFSSFASDMLIKKEILSVGTCRKLCNTIGQWGPAVALLTLSYTRNQTIVYIIYTIGVSLLGFVNIGFNINYLDIVPSIAGFFMGITNGCSTISYIAGAEFARIIVNDLNNKYQWRIVFAVSAGVFFFSNLIFITFGSGEVQSIEDDELKNESNSRMPTFSRYSHQC